jgi:hypothetical protein
MTAWIVFGITLAAFVGGVIADASSSLGMRERTKIFRDKNGIFSLRRYLLLMGALIAAGVVFGVLSSPYPPAASFAFGAVMRFRVAAKNRKLWRNK